MKKLFSHLLLPRTTEPTSHNNRNLFDWLLEPVATIIVTSERRRANLVSAILVNETLFMIFAVVYFGFFTSNPTAAYVFIGADILMLALYFLSRTRYNQLSGILALFVLSVIPFLYIIVSKVFDLEGILIFISANIVMMLFSSTITSVLNTAIFAIIDILTIILIPIILPSASILYVVLTLITNIVLSACVLVFTHQRSLMEKDRVMEMAKLNQSLQVELTQRKLTEDRLAYTSVHDPLTDLPNRVLFIDRLGHAIERAKRHLDFKYAVFFLDLDRFKVVNDSLGHRIGDMLLVESSQRLKACMRGEDTVARLGGDEFVILLEDIKDDDDVLQVAERIQNSLAMPYDLDGHMVFVFVSMGIVMSGADYTRPDDVLRDADIAMYRAKGQGLGRYEIFDPAMLDRVMSRMELETELRKALENQQFVVHYQPILNMASQRIIGFEALVRWQHPTKGLIPPADFIPTAEETSLIIPLGYWVLDEACRQIHSWNVQYSFDPPLSINVNLSTRQCEQKDIVQKISDILRKNKLDPSLLKLELTESLIIKDSEDIIAMLSELRDLGIQVQIDDFGTGYSSLSYLHTLPIDTLKIDRSFVSRMGSKNEGNEIVQTILNLAHNLGMKVIAEGVETDEQFSSLMAMDCEFMQGFLFSKAVDSLEAGAMLREVIGSFAGQK